MPYIAPGDAASSRFADVMLQQDQMRRQAMLDQIAQQREQRLADYQKSEMEQGAESLRLRREEAEQRNRDRRIGDFEKTVGNMTMGDIPDAVTLKEADSLGMGHLFPPDPTGHRIYSGSAKERLEKKTRDEAMAFAQTIQNPNERSAFEFSARFPGRNPPAGMFKTGEDVTPVARVDPQRQVVQRLVNGQWQDVQGDVPKGTHFLQEPTPKDTSAADAAKTDREARRVDALREHAYTELNAIDKDFRGQLVEYDKVGAMLNQKTAQADADVAPLILKATVGGMGSGFRMTRAEIDNTLKGRTKWEDLEATLNKWSTDPQHFVIPDEQREAMKSLARAIRKKAYDLYHKVLDARAKIDETDDPKAINRLRTGLQDELFPAESPELEPSRRNELINRARQK